MGSQIWQFSPKKNLVHGILVKHSLDMFNPTVLRHLRIFVDARFVFDALGPVCIPTRAMMHHGTGRRLQRMTRSNPLWTMRQPSICLCDIVMNFAASSVLFEAFYFPISMKIAFFDSHNLPLFFFFTILKKPRNIQLQPSIYLTQSTLTSRRSRHSCSPPASGYFIASRLVASAWHPCG